jgi:hypothetical protein
LLLQRQYAKSDLASALTALDEASVEGGGASLLSASKGNKGGKMSLTVKDLQRLMLPLDVRSSVVSDEIEGDEGGEEAATGEEDYVEEREALDSDPVLRLAVERLRGAQRADCAGVRYCLAVFMRLTFILFAGCCSC